MTPQTHENGPQSDERGADVSQEGRGEIGAVKRFSEPGTWPTPEEWRVNFLRTGEHWQVETAAWVIERARQAARCFEQNHDDLAPRLAEAEAKVARVEALAESWRYKGEFGWGPWQTGEGPDQEGIILDGCAEQIRRALDGPR